MMKRSAILTVILALGLTGCSQGNGEPNATLSTLANLRDVIQNKRAPKSEPVVLSRAALNSVPSDVLEATVENLGQTAFLVVNVRRSDDLPGQVTVWRQSGGTTLSFRDDILIATRGLGGDIISSDVAAIQQAIEMGQGGGQRVHFVRTEDNKERRLSMACSVSDLGPESLEIVELKFNTRHLQEQCSNALGQVTNDYWVDSQDGTVRQSRQWAGPYIGYLRLRRLK
jgi:hypothetical protein